ncbi:MAG: DUF3035 domain-containing protein [Asticcacaulis sp.]
MSLKPALVCVAVSAVVLSGGLAGCQSTSKALGLAKVTPDEFRVVTKAPLTLPPEYGLRPPAPGSRSADTIRQENLARQSLLAQREQVQRSDGERLLVIRAGADRSDPLASHVVDDEFGNIAHKDEGFADKVMFWRKKEPNLAANAAAPATLDPTSQAEAERLQKLTGGKPVLIARDPQKKFKLPGL